MTRILAEKPASKKVAQAFLPVFIGPQAGMPVLPGRLPD